MRQRDRLQGGRFIVSFLSPKPNYYDGKLATQFETCIKDKFEGLQTINEVDSDYVKKALLELEKANTT